MTSCNQTKTEQAKYNFTSLTQDGIIQLAEDSDELSEVKEVFNEVIPDYNEFVPFTINLVRARELIESGIDYEGCKEELDSLRQFWVDCWYQLSKEYPAPKVSSDYDKGILLDRVRAGDKVLSRINELENDSNKTVDELVELELLKELTS